jgi:hypothetical protein
VLLTDVESEAVSGPGERGRNLAFSVQGATAKKISALERGGCQLIDIKRYLMAKTLDFRAGFRSNLTVSNKEGIDDIERFPTSA